MSQNIFTGSLTRIVRSIMQQKYTGILFVEQVGGAGAERGKIHFENGSLVRAYSTQEVGKAALQRISTWKEISYTFQSRSGTNPHTGPVSVPSRVSGRECVRSVRPARVSTTPRQTGSFARVPETESETRNTGPVQRTWYAGERDTHPLHPRQAEIVTSAHDKATSSQIPVHTGESASVSQESGLARRAPAITRQIAEIETIHLPTWPPTPRLVPQSGAEALPGRSAVFQTSPTVPVVRAIQDMERRARIVFILVNGQRTIADIARLTHQSESEVEQTLVKLAQRGYTHRVRG